jgi:ATP-dependent RNA helicase DeaD
VQDHLIERLLEEGFTSTDIASACLAQLQSGEAAARPPRTENYERPERPGRGNFRDDPRERFDDRRAPRSERRERVERPLRTDRHSPEPQRQRPVERMGLKQARSETKPAMPTGESEGRARHSVGAEASLPASGARGVTSPNTEARLSAETKPAAERTYSDEEILASVKAPEPATRKIVGPKSAPPWANKQRAVTKLTAKVKPGRATPPNQIRLWMNLGEAMDIKPIDIVNAIAAETGLPGKVVGAVDVRDRHLFVDVAAEQATGIIARLNRTQIKGHKVKVKVA